MIYDSYPGPSPQKCQYFLFFYVPIKVCSFLVYCLYILNFDVPVLLPILNLTRTNSDSLHAPISESGTKRIQAHPA